MSLIHRSTPAGHQATIIDDDRKVCKGKGTGLWLDNKFIAAAENGSINIPYGNREEELKLIMLHDNFAQLSNFTRKRETY